MLSKKFVAVATTTLALSTYATKKLEKPNFLFIISDDQSYDTISALYNTGVRTPNLDKLVKNGVTFTHAFNQGSYSAAVCVCSRAMLISGANLRSCKHNFNKKQFKLWGETFRNSGYETYVTGKWHNGDWSVHKSFTKGDMIGPGMCPSTNLKGAAYHRPAQGNNWTPHETKWSGHWQPTVGHYDPLAKNPNKCIKRVKGDKHTSNLYGDTAVNYLENDIANSEKPFFMYVAFNAPHDPRQAPKKYVDMYPANKIKVPKNFLPKHPFNQGHNKIRDEILAPFPRTKSVVQTHLQEYYAIITHMDAQIGRILDALEKSGKSKNTYVIFTSDHGLAVGQHGLMGKQNQYDHSVRVPLIFTGPTIPKNKQTSAMSYIHSIFPTTCDLAGIEIPENVESQSLIPNIKDLTKKGQSTIFGSYFTMQRMVRTDRYKLIEYNVGKEKNVQLFDLKKDPLEMKNLATIETATVEKMRQKFKEGEEKNMLPIWK